MTNGRLLRSLRHRGEPERSYRYPLVALDRHDSQQLPSEPWQQQDRRRERHGLQVLHSPPGVPVRLSLSMAVRVPVPRAVFMTVAGHRVRVSGVLRPAGFMLTGSAMSPSRPGVAYPLLRRFRKFQPPRVLDRRVQHRRQHEAVHHDHQAEVRHVAAVLRVAQQGTLGRRKGGWLPSLPSSNGVARQSALPRATHRMRSRPLSQA